jgi:cleavage and polyadenylation specificity factor subunit 2
MQGNVIVLTSRSQEDTLARDLYDQWEEKQVESARWGRGEIGQVASVSPHMQIEVSSMSECAYIPSDQYQSASRRR